MILTKDEIQRVIQLANEFNDASERFTGKYFPDGIIDLGKSFGLSDSTPEGIAEDEKFHEILNYVMSLDYEKILDLEALMLYGRDGDKDQDPISEFKSVRDWLAENYRDSSEDSKFMAADYIVSKSPLVEYLESALESLGI